MKKIGILGSTGSIGTQTIEVCRKHNIRVLSLSTNVNIELVEEQAREFNPLIVAVFDQKKADILKERLKDTAIEVCAGIEGLIKASTVDGADIILTAVVGMIGLLPTIKAIEKGYDIALANKETLVCAGEIVMKLAREKNVKILPVDSEHSAIFQCLDGSEKYLKKIILTASGGPFFGYNSLNGVTKEQALNHPNWTMGSKITIDSATMMNKGLEYIEAIWLFNTKNIDILVHRESIIHSMVEYIDNSVIAQMSTPDMKLPIQYALTYPERFVGDTQELDLIKCGKLSFFEPDENVFKCLKLAKEAGIRGGNAGAVLNAANELAVDLFLNGKIAFSEIADAVEYAVKNVPFISQLTLEDVFESDKKARQMVKQFIEKR